LNDRTTEDDIDFVLMRRARTGDYDAFTQLVERFQPRVYALARRIVPQPSDAEDVVQQTFLSMIEHLDSYREEASVAAWVLRIASNHALKWLRRQRTRHEVALDSSAGDDRYASLPHPEYIAQWRDTPDELAQRHEVQALLAQALTELDEKYRLVFVLRDLEGLSIHDTAHITGLTEGTVKVRLLRARLQLRERLTQALGDDATRLFPDHSHGASA
jgi:RNA polymerase sigma-70 factor (ECF subfamily)